MFPNSFCSSSITFPGLGGRHLLASVNSPILVDFFVFICRPSLSFQPNEWLWKFEEVNYVNSRRYIYNGTIFTQSFPYRMNRLNKKKVRESPWSATITNRSPSQTPRGRENRQIQTSTNRTNVRKALRLALSSPSEVWKTQEQNDTRYDIQKSPRRINHKGTKRKTNTGTTALERSVE